MATSFWAELPIQSSDLELVVWPHLLSFIATFEGGLLTRLTKLGHTPAFPSDFKLIINAIYDLSLIHI